MTDDIVLRIRRRFPRPVDADGGLLANDAADVIERYRTALEKIADNSGPQMVTLEGHFRAVEIARKALKGGA